MLVDKLVKKGQCKFNFVFALFEISTIVNHFSSVHEKTWQFLPHPYLASQGARGESSHQSSK